MADSKVTRPRGAPVNKERRQRPLHPDVRSAQEAHVSEMHEGKHNGVNEHKKEEQPEASGDGAQVQKREVAAPQQFGSKDQTPSTENKVNNIQQPGPSPVAPVDEVRGAGGKGAASITTPPGNSPRT